MVIFSTVLVLSLAPTLPRAPVEHDHVVLASRSIRLADVLPSARAEVRDRVLANIPADRDRFVLSRAAIAALTRRALPGLMIDRPRIGNVTFALRPRADRPKPTQACSALKARVAAGTAIDTTMVTRIACSNARPASLTFDRSAALPRTAANLADGTYLGRLSLRAAGLDKGRATDLVSTVGPVRIIRTVTTLQASHGRRVFVRDADGQIFSVRRAELAK